MEHCICNHIIKGEYTDEDAEKGIRNVVDFAAKIYNRIFGSGDGFGCFSVDTRREVARRYVENKRKDWHYCASYEMRDRVLTRALKGMYSSGGNWSIEPGAASDNDLRRVLRCHGKMKAEFFRRFNSADCCNPAFFRRVWQLIESELVWYENLVKWSREDADQPDAGRRAALIIDAAKNAYNI